MSNSNNNNNETDYMFAKLMLVVASLVLGDMMGRPALVMGMAIFAVLFGGAVWELLNVAAELLLYGVGQARGDDTAGELIESAVSRINRLASDGADQVAPPVQQPQYSRPVQQPQPQPQPQPQYSRPVQQPQPQHSRPVQQPQPQPQPQPVTVKRNEALSRNRPFYDDGPFTAVAHLPRLKDEIGEGSVFIYGNSGAGKTSVMKHVLSTRSGECVVADPHSEPGKWPKGCMVVGSTSRGPNFADIASAIRALVRKMNERYGDMADGKATEGDFKPICLATDEYFAIVNDKVNGKEIAEGIKSLLTQGRKVGLSVVISSQDRSVVSTGFAGTGFLRQTFAFVRVSGSIQHNVPFRCFVSFGMDGEEVEVEHPGALMADSAERGNQTISRPASLDVSDDDDDDDDDYDDDCDDDGTASIEVNKLPDACRLMAQAGLGESECSQLFGASPQIVKLVFDSISVSVSGIPSGVSEYAARNGLSHADCVAICALVYAGVSANKCVEIVSRRRTSVLKDVQWAKTVGVPLFKQETTQE